MVGHFETPGTRKLRTSTSSCSCHRAAPSVATARPACTSGVMTGGSGYAEGLIKDHLWTLGLTAAHLPFSL